ncbi:MAG: efflux RND transporter periplasmic adaptor subunit [Magnetococcales bacterium]|nr:efflux RND transporter periplasmic adaptor subunit [Magnetococcales bacterium]
MKNFNLKSHLKIKRALFVFSSLFLFSITGCDLLTKPEVSKAKKSPAKHHLVEVSQIKTQPLSHATQRTGTLIARGQVKVFNQEEGRIETLKVYEGDYVDKSDLLIKLDDKLLKSQLAKTVANREKAESDLERVEVLKQKKFSSAEKMIQAYTDLKVAKAEESLIRTRLGYTKILAPFGGIISKRLVDPGDVAPRHTHLLTMIDPKSLYTEVMVSELLLPHFKIGDSAQVLIDALGSQPFPGKIVRIHPTIDPRTRQGVVEVQLIEVPPNATAGQLCRVTLHTPTIKRRVITFASLQRDRKNEYVYVFENGVAHQKKVVTGLRIGDEVEILEGIVDGEQVIIRGFLGLTDGKKVKRVKQKIAEKPAS